MLSLFFSGEKKSINKIRERDAAITHVKCDEHDKCLLSSKNELIGTDNLFHADLFKAFISVLQ